MLKRMDILDFLWRSLGSRGATLLILSTLIVVLACGAWLPQRPHDLVIESPEYARWRAEIQARYLQWAHPLVSLGFFSVRDSYWLKIPLGLMTINLLICAVERFETIRRRRQPSAQDFTSNLDLATQRRSFLMAGMKQPVLARLTQILEDRRYAVDTREHGSVSYLAARRFAFVDWGILIGHILLILIIASVMVGGGRAWREPNIALGPGQEYHIQHVQPLSARLEQIHANPSPGGEAQSWDAEVTILDDGREVTRGLVSPGAPLWYKGISLHHLSQGPLISISARDADGAAVSLQTLAPAGTVLKEAILLLSEEDSEGYLTVPDRNLVLRVIYQPEPLTAARGSASLSVQAYHAGTTEQLSSETLSESKTLEIEGDFYVVDWGQYAVFSMVSDPTVVPLMACILLLLAGTVVAIFLRPQLVWATVRSQEGVIAVQFMNPGGERAELEVAQFDRLAAEIEEGIRGL